MSFVHRIDELVEESGSGLTNKATHWERVPLGLVAEVINGFPFPSSGFNNEEIGEAVIRIRDVTSGEVATYFRGGVAGAPRVGHGDLVIGMDGNFNSRLWPVEAALMNQRVCKVVPDERFYSKALLAYASVNSSSIPLRSLPNSLRASTAPPQSENGWSRIRSAGAISTLAAR